MSASILTAALLLDAALGEPRTIWSRWPHPAVLMGRAVGWMDTRLNQGESRRARGVLAMAALGLGAILLGNLIHALPDFGLIEVLVVAILLAQKSLVEHVRAVGDGLRMSIGEGRRAVARIVGRDTAAMDQPAIARAAIESAAENLSDGVIAPLFWGAIFGLPGILAYKAINTLDSMIGHRNARYEMFGWAAARIDDGANLIPARLTGLLFALVSRRTGAALRCMARDARQHRSPNAGWPEAALAGALGFALAGPRSYGGKMIEASFMGEGGRRELGPADIRRALKLTRIADYLLIGLFGLLALVSL